MTKRTCAIVKCQRDHSSFGRSPCFDSRINLGPRGTFPNHLVCVWFNLIRPGVETWSDQYTSCFPPHSLIKFKASSKKCRACFRLISKEPSTTSGLFWLYHHCIARGGITSRTGTSTDPFRPAGGGGCPVPPSNRAGGGLRLRGVGGEMGGQLRGDKAGRP